MGHAPGFPADKNPRYPENEVGVSGLEHAWLRVGDEWRRWPRGELLVFDDAFEHEVAEAPWRVAEWAVALRFDNPRATVLVLL